MNQENDIHYCQQTLEHEQSVYAYSDIKNGLNATRAEEYMRKLKRA